MYFMLVIFLLIIKGNLLWMQWPSSKANLLGAAGGAEHCPVPSIGCWVCGRGELHYPPHSPCAVRSVRMDVVQSHSNGAECASCAVAAIPFRFTFASFPLWQRAVVKSSSHPSREQAQPNFVIQGCIYQNSTQFSTLLGFCLSSHFVNQLLITPYVAPRAKFPEVQFGNRSICIHKQLA